MPKGCKLVCFDWTGLDNWPNLLLKTGSIKVFHCVSCFGLPAAEFSRILRLVRVLCHGSIAALLCTFLKKCANKSRSTRKQQCAKCTIIHKQINLIKHTSVNQVYCCALKGGLRRQPRPRRRLSRRRSLLLLVFPRLRIQN